MPDTKPTISKLMRKEDTLLVLVDVQERLLPVIHGKEDVLANVVRLAEFAKIIHLPVVITEQQKLGDTMPELKSVADDAKVFGKITFDCFAEEAFRAYVGLSGRRTLILAGIESHICVAQTALSAADQYRVYVVADAVSSRSPHNKDIALTRLQQEGVKITSTEMAIYELLREAGTPEFKSTLKLVK